MKDVIEYKSFGLKVTKEPDDEGYFEGYAAVFGNVDLQGDVIERGAFTKTLQENPTVPILWQHDPDKPIGGSVTMAEDTTGLKVSGQLVMDVQLAKEARSLMLAKVVNGLSVGYKTVQRSFEKTAEGVVRHLKEIRLIEWSPCVFPANQLALVGDVKSRKWLGQYSATEGVDCLLSMIGAGADFLAEEVEEGDTEDVTRMQTVLSTLADILASEMDEVAAGESESEGDPDVVVWVEQMRAPVELAVKDLQALLDREPVAATHDVDGAVEENAEPAIATLRDLASALTR